MESFSKIIENKELWLTSSTKMNDTAEGEWLTLALKEYINTNSLSTNAEREFFDALLNAMQSNSRHIYLSSFSEDGDSLGQWREYGDKGMGIAIGFNVDLFHVGKIKNLWDATFHYDEYYIFKVDYKKYDEMAKFLCEYLKAHPYKKTKTNARKIAMQLLHWRAIFKNDSFSEEKEWRLVVEPNIFRRPKKHGWYSKTLPLETVRTRITPKGLSTYIPFPILDEKQPQIKKVILGPRNQTAEDDLNFFLCRNNLGDVEISRSRSTFCG